MIRPHGEIASVVANTPRDLVCGHFAPGHGDCYGARQQLEARLLFANPLWTPPRSPRPKPSARRDAPLLERLADAAALADRLPPSPDARALRARLERYRYVVRGWVTFSPTDEQREALRAQIDDVFRRVVEGLAAV